MTTKTLHGICNAAFFSTRPDGTETYFASRAARDAALVRLRARAVEAGLSRTAATAGIYAIEDRLDRVRDAYDGHHVTADLDAMDLVF